MAEIVKPRDLNPGFLKSIEDKYGEIDMTNDFFKPDLTTYYKATDIDAEGDVTHKIIRLPSFGKLFTSLGQARNDAEELSTDDTLRGDEKFQSQVDNISKTFRLGQFISPSYFLKRILTSKKREKLNVLKNIYY